MNKDLCYELKFEEPQDPFSYDCYITRGDLMLTYPDKLKHTAVGFFNHIKYTDIIPCSVGHFIRCISTGSGSKHQKNCRQNKDSLFYFGIFTYTFHATQDLLCPMT